MAIQTGQSTTLSSQKAEDVAAAAAQKLLDDQAAALGLAKTKEDAVVFVTGIRGLNYVFNDGRVDSFKGTELVVTDGKQITELRAAQKSGAPFWEVEVSASVNTETKVST